MGSFPRNVLIVEGFNDRHFVDHLLRPKGFRKATKLADSKNFIITMPEWTEAEAVRIVVADGFDEIPSAIRNVLRPDDLDGFAIIADTDLIEDNRWESLRGTLGKFGFSGLPDLPPAGGLVMDNLGIPALGVWMMPDNQSSGMIESFACKLVNAEDPSWLHARLAVAELPEAEGQFSRSRHLEKALIHTWLAWREEPGCQLGTAVAKGYLRNEHEEVARFCDWIEGWLRSSSARRRLRD
jgi:hypothetical protein